jgi:ligand-binding sensor domain-containing protein
MADGLSGDRVHATAVEAPNLVWFVHENAGVSVLDHRGTPLNKSDDVWTTFDEHDALVNESVYSVVVDGDGRKWFGACDGLWVLEDGGTPHDESDDVWTTFSSRNCNPGLTIDAWGRKWVAEGWRGIYMLDEAGTLHDPSDDILHQYTIAEGLVDNRTHSVAVSGDGTVWVGTDGGLGKLSPASNWLYLPVITRRH